MLLRRGFPAVRSWRIRAGLITSTVRPGACSLTDPARERLRGRFCSERAARLFQPGFFGSGELNYVISTPSIRTVDTVGGLEVFVSGRIELCEALPPREGIPHSSRIVRISPASPVSVTRNRVNGGEIKLSHPRILGRDLRACKESSVKKNDNSAVGTFGG